MVRLLGKLAELIIKPDRVLKSEDEYTNFLNQYSLIKEIDSKVGRIELFYLKEPDVEAQLSYLYDSPKEFLEDIGFDTSKLPGKEKHRTFLLRDLKKEVKSQKVVARVNGKTIACVFLDLRSNSPKAHFHIYTKEYRGKGIGSLIFKEGVKQLMEDFAINELTVEPKIENVAMNKMLEKCGFKNLGESVYKSAVTKEFKSMKYLVEVKKLRE